MSACNNVCVHKLVLAFHLLHYTVIHYFRVGKSLCQSCNALCKSDAKVHSSLFSYGMTIAFMILNSYE